MVAVISQKEQTNRRKKLATEFLQAQEKEASQLAESQGLQAPTKQIRKQATAQTQADITQQEQQAAAQGETFTQTQVPVSEVQARAASVSQLSQQQQQEQQDLFNQIDISPQVDTLTRVAKSGLVLPSIVANALGATLDKAGISKLIGTEGRRTSPESIIENPTFGKLGKAQGIFLGVAAAPLIKLANWGGVLGANAKELKGDAQSYKQASSLILRDVSKGGNVDNAIAQMTKLESAIRSKFADAEKSLKQNPTDVAAGIDYSEDMYNYLNTVTLRRQALERYKLTGDFLSLQLTTQNAAEEEFLSQA